MAFRELNQTLRKLRKQSGYTQEQIASLLEMDRTSYACYELGRTEPNIATLIKLAQIFQVSLDTLLGIQPAAQFSDKSSSSPPVQAEDWTLTAQELSLLIRFRSMTSKQKAALLELLSTNPES